MTVAKPIFLDTGFAIALLSPRDQYHSAARRLAVELRTAPARVITTDAVIFEIGAALAKQAWRPAAIQFIKALRADPNVEIVSTDPCSGKTLSTSSAPGRTKNGVSPTACRLS